MFKRTTDRPGFSWRIRKRSFLLALVVLSIPWAAVSIPNNGNDMVGWRGFAEFGWPIVHAQDRSSKPATMRVLFGRNPDGIAWNARLNREEEWGEIESGFWSNKKLWPFHDPAESYNVFPLELCLNLVLLGLSAYVTAVVMRLLRRERRGFRFSLRTLIGMSTVAALICIGSVQQFRNHAAIDRIRKDTVELANARINVSDYAQKRFRLPLVVSQLLNHGYVNESIRVPQELIAPISAVDLHLNFPSTVFYDGLKIDGEQLAENIAELSKYVAVKINFDIDDFDRDILQALEEVARGTDVRVLDLDIDFHACDSVFLEKIDTPFAWVHWVESIECVSLTLAPSKQGAQLSQFTNMTNADDIEIWQVSREGAEFLLESCELWPAGMTIEFMDSVPGTLEMKVYERLKAKSFQGLCGTCAGVR